MSSVVPEGPVPESADEPAQGSGFRAAHVAGGGGACAVGTVVVAVCNHFGWHVSDADALLIGAASVSAGVGIGHVVGKVGIFGAFKTLLYGRSS